MIWSAEAIASRHEPLAASTRDARKDQAPVVRRLAHAAVDRRRRSAHVTVSQFEVSQPHTEPRALLDGQVRALVRLVARLPKYPPRLAPLAREFRPPCEPWRNAKLRLMRRTEPSIPMAWS
jgi:hypothetical protein